MPSAPGAAKSVVFAALASGERFARHRSRELDALVWAPRAVRQSMHGGTRHRRLTCAHAAASEPRSAPATRPRHSSSSASSSSPGSGSALTAAFVIATYSIAAITNFRTHPGSSTVTSSSNPFRISARPSGESMLM